jgi:hypothetical protein
VGGAADSEGGIAAAAPVLGSSGRHVGSTVQYWERPSVEEVGNQALDALHLLVRSDHGEDARQVNQEELYHEPGC